MSRGRAWKSVFPKSLVIWILCLIWGVSEGLSSFYRPLLDLPVALLISAAFVLVFPLCHLHPSPDPEYSLIDYAPTCSHVLLSFYLQPSSPPNSDFYFDLVPPPRPLAALHSLRVPQNLPACCAPWPSSLCLPLRICPCSLLFSGRAPTPFVPRTHTFT